MPLWQLLRTQKPDSLHTPPTLCRGGAHLVVVSQMHCMPLPITQASWNYGADHCIGFTCGEYICGVLSGVPEWHHPILFT